MPEYTAAQHTLRLDALVRAVCPIDGAFIGTLASAATWGFHPTAAATPAEIAAGQAVVALFDPSNTAHEQWLKDTHPERTTLRDNAVQAIADGQAAIADNDAYLLIGTPTNAQVVQQVRRLTQQNNRIITTLLRLVRRLVQID